MISPNFHLENERLPLRGSGPGGLASAHTYATRWGRELQAHPLVDNNRNSRGALASISRCGLARDLALSISSNRSWARRIQSLLTIFDFLLRVENRMKKPRRGFPPGAHFVSFNFLNTAIPEGCQVTQALCRSSGRLPTSALGLPADAVHALRYLRVGSGPAPGQ
jgi:hypothetical protein